MEGKVILGYWKIRGLAERLRQLLEYCGLPYTQEKYDGSSDREKWNNQIKPLLLSKNPAINLPYLLDGEKVICESDAISLYICFKANKPQLTGRTNDQKITMATVWGVFKDTHIQYVGLCYGHYGPLEVALKNFPTQLRPYLQKLNGLLGQSKFFAGQITYIDFAIADFLQALRLLLPQFVAEFPKLIQYQQRVWSLPELKDYFNSPRFQQRPINNVMAVWK